MKSLVVVVVLLVAAGSACAQTDRPRIVAHTAPSEDVLASPADSIKRALDELPGLAESTLERTGVPGLAVAVVHGGETVFAKGYGVKRLGGDDPVDADTVFQIASVSKSVGATVIATQVSAGIVDWSTPVAELLPDFALADPWVTKHVTIGDLYSHRSGLPTGAGDDLEAIGYDREYVLSHLAYEPLDQFRQTYNYANFGMTAGAQAVATAAGKSWEDLSEDELYKPLGMTSTSSRYTDFLARAN